MILLDFFLEVTVSNINFSLIEIKLVCTFTSRAPCLSQSFPSTPSWTFISHTPHSGTPLIPRSKMSTQCLTLCLSKRRLATTEPVQTALQFTAMRDSQDLTYLRLAKVPICLLWKTVGLQQSECMLLGGLHFLNAAELELDDMMLQSPLTSTPFYVKDILKPEEQQLTHRGHSHHLSHFPPPHFQSMPSCMLPRHRDNSSFSDREGNLPYLSALDVRDQERGDTSLSPNMYVYSGLQGAKLGEPETSELRLRSTVTIFYSSLTKTYSLVSITKNTFIHPKTFFTTTKNL